MIAKTLPHLVESSHPLGYFLKWGNRMNWENRKIRGRRGIDSESL